MKAVTRVGDKNTGHDACGAVPLAEGSSNVFINGKPCGRVGDKYVSHGCIVHGPHQDVISAGASGITVNGCAMARVDDAVSIGGSVAEGSPTVSCGDAIGLNCCFEIVRTVIENFKSIINETISNGSVEDDSSSSDSSDVEDDSSTSDDGSVIEGGNVSNDTVCYTDTFSEGDDIILATPDIALQESKDEDKDSNDQIGWYNLSVLLKRWISASAYILDDTDISNGTAPYYSLNLDWSWYMSYSRFADAYNDLVQNTLSEDGLKQLVKRLKQDGVWDKGGDFDFSSKPENEWELWYSNFRVVSQPFLIVDGMTALLAGHSLRSLVKGTVTKNDDGSTTIECKNIYIYMDDRFNFNGEQDYGWWSKKLNKYSSLIGIMNDDYYNLSNKDFNGFRKKFNKGGDFIVHSKLHDCTEFTGQTFKVEESSNSNLFFIPIFDN